MTTIITSTPEPCRTTESDAINDESGRVNAERQRLRERAQSADTSLPAGTGFAVPLACFRRAQNKLAGKARNA
jgi:hypothetical protein